MWIPRWGGEVCNHVCMRKTQESGRLWNKISNWKFPINRNKSLIFKACVCCLDALSFVVPHILDVNRFWAGCGWSTFHAFLRGHRAILERCQETRQDGFWSTTVVRGAARDENLIPLPKCQVFPGVAGLKRGWLVNNSLRGSPLNSHGVFLGATTKLPANFLRIRIYRHTLPSALATLFKPQEMFSAVVFPGILQGHTNRCDFAGPAPLPPKNTAWVVFLFAVGWYINNDMCFFCKSVLQFPGVETVLDLGQVGQV